LVHLRLDVEGRTVHLLLTPILACLLSTPAFSQTRDPLDQAKATEALKAQKAKILEEELRNADRDSRAVGVKDPAGALAILQNALVRLEADDSLPEEKKAAWRRDLSRWMEAYKGKQQDQAIGKGVYALDTKTNPYYRRNEEERAKAEQDYIKQSLDQAQQLRRAGKNVEAAQIATDLLMRFPGNPSIAAVRAVVTRNDVLADARSVKELRDSRDLQTQRGIFVSSIPETADRSFPPDWKEKSERRSPAMQLTQIERKILKALNAPMSVDFKSEPLQNVIDYLQKQIGEPIIIPREVLAEVNTAYDTPITIQGDRMSTRSILKKVLAELNLTYVIKDQVIQVTTRERAKDMMTTRVYYIRDLATGVNFSMGPVGNQLQMIQNINNLMALITTTIDPQSWAPNGPATIAFEPATMSLIIRQSAEVHMMIGVGLR
jgi:hypothetical protein